MNYEKAYKEALERARELYDNLINEGTLATSKGIESIFPELRESEDERIRKELLEHCINRRDGKQVCVDASDYRRWAAWLEKQGEKTVEQDTETNDLWVYIREWNEKFGRLPKDEDELASCIDYVMKRQKPADKIEQNLSWSEEDEYLYNWCVSALTTRYNDGLFTTSEYKQTKLWLKSLKDRGIPQSKQEWSEEDDYVIEKLLCLLDNEQNNYPQLSCDFQELQEIKDWLKSIKPNHWKPSEEQIGALNYAYCELFKRGENSEGSNCVHPLMTLIDDLKKL